MNKSFLKWAGGKTQSIDFIKEVLPKKIVRFVEPFVGSGVMSLNIDADSYLLADCNQDLINLFENIKNNGTDFIAYCQKFFIDGNNKSVYYSRRDTFNSLTFNTERAALFLYLNRHAFNGLCRYNLSGKFNVPFGKYKSVYFPDKEMLVFHKKAKKFEFLCCDFEETFNREQKGDVFYCDPPYIPLGASSYFTSYVDKIFTFDHQKKLVACAEASECKVLISNHWIPQITEELYKNGDCSHRKFINRFISAKASGRGKVEEVLVVYN